MIWTGSRLGFVARYGVKTAARTHDILTDHYPASVCLGRVMYLKRSIRKKSGRTYLVIAQKYRDPRTGTSTDRTVKSLGYLDELQKEYDDPIAHFKEVCRQMTEEERAQKRLNFAVDMDETLSDDADDARNLGYAVPLSVYYDLALHTFLSDKASIKALDIDANSIMILLVMIRILAPGSRKRALEEKDRFFEKFNFQANDIYRALSYYNKVADGLKRFMHGTITSAFGRDTGIVYYDVTNYYFESRLAGGIQYVGTPRQTRKKPTVQMGLAMDREGIPIHYELLRPAKRPGETFRTVINEICDHYASGRIVIVADMGTKADDRIAFLTDPPPDKPQNGYVFSVSIADSPDGFKEYVLDGRGYKDRDGKVGTNESDFKVKSRIVNRTVDSEEDRPGARSKRSVKEKQIVFWSRELLVKSRAARADAIAKAKDMIKDPGLNSEAVTYGISKYVDHLEFDDETGKILATNGSLVLNRSKIKEEERLDGYYSLVTSEIDLPDSELVSMYNRLWEIEESFKIMKWDLESRPIFTKDHTHTNAHFLIYFISLTILRLIQKKLDWKFAPMDIINSLNRIQCMHEVDNIYLFSFKSEITEALGSAFGIDLTKKRLTLNDINNILREVKR
jgi:transposase